MIKRLLPLLLFPALAFGQPTSNEMLCYQPTASDLNVTTTPAASSVQEVEGDEAEGIDLDTIPVNPVIIAGKDINGLILIPTLLNAAGLGVFGASIVDAGGELVDVTNNSVQITGGEAHDAVDAGNPVKIGGRARNYEPTTTGELGGADVASGDRADLALNQKGQPVEGVNVFRQSIPTLDGAYTNTTEVISDPIKVWNYRECRFFYCIQSTGTPTNFFFTIQGSPDGVKFFDYPEWYLSTIAHEDTQTATQVCKSVPFKSIQYYLKFKGVCNGCSGTGTKFDISDSYLLCRN